MLERSHLSVSGNPRTGPRLEEHKRLCRRTRTIRHCIIPTLSFPLASFLPSCTAASDILTTTISESKQPRVSPSTSPSSIDLARAREVKNKK